MRLGLLVSTCYSWRKVSVVSSFTFTVRKEVMDAPKKMELRSRIRTTLKALETEYLTAQSRAACERLISSEGWQTARAITCYCSMAAEFQTSRLLEAAFAAGKRVFLPRVESISERRMVMLEAESVAEIETWPRSKWGIPEPPGVRPDALECDELDLVVVPGLAFDVGRNRLGQGAGFYDTWLAKLNDITRPSFPRIVALALDEQLLHDEIVPTDPHDVPLDEVFSATHHWRAP